MAYPKMRMLKPWRILKEDPESMAKPFKMTPGITVITMITTYDHMYTACTQVMYTDTLRVHRL